MEGHTQNTDIHSTKVAAVWSCSSLDSCSTTVAAERQGFLMLDVKISRYTTRRNNSAHYDDYVKTRQQGGLLVRRVNHEEAECFSPHVNRNPSLRVTSSTACYQLANRASHSFFFPLFIFFIPSRLSSRRPSCCAPPSRLHLNADKTQSGGGGGRTWPR